MYARWRGVIVGSFLAARGVELVWGATHRRRGIRNAHDLDQVCCGRGSSGGRLTVQAGRWWSSTWAAEAFAKIRGPPNANSGLGPERPPGRPRCRSGAVRTRPQGRQGGPSGWQGRLSGWQGGPSWWRGSPSRWQSNYTGPAR